MSDHSDLIADLRTVAASLKRANGQESRSTKVCDRAAAALSSQSLSLSEAREEIERLRGAVTMQSAMSDGTGSMLLDVQRECIEFRRIVSGFLHCPEIAECAPEDKDPDTDALERRARSVLENGPTPTRDEAVLYARYEPEWGRMMLCNRGQFGAVEYRLVSAPAPASGGVEAVAWRAVAHAETGMGAMIHPIKRYLVQDADGIYGKGQWDLQALVVGADTSDDTYNVSEGHMLGPVEDALSPAATPVSEAEPVAWLAQSGGLNADWVAMVLAEDARIEDGKLANGPYLAVKIAEAADLPSEVSRLRGALANIRDHTRETSTATMALGALAKPASSPAVTTAMIDAGCAAWASLYPAFEGEKPQPSAGDVVKAIVTAALSQSTSAGRGE